MLKVVTRKSPSSGVKSGQPSRLKPPVIMGKVCLQCGKLYNQETEVCKDCGLPTVEIYSGGD